MQPSAQRKAADARLQPFDGRPVLYLAVLYGFAAVCVLCIYLVVVFILTSEPGIRAIAIDYRVMWAAARLALEGAPLSVFDSAQMWDVHRVRADIYMPWLYPPGYLTLITPFGLMDFAPSMVVWTLLSLAAVTLALRPFLAGVVPLGIALVLAPAFLPALTLGQNSLFWMAGLLAALAALRSGRFWLAGVLIGCLTLKPQLGILIPFALLAIRAWPTIIAATATTVLLAVLPTFAYGLDYWPLLSKALVFHADAIRDQITVLNTMIGPMYAIAFLGLPEHVAQLVQALITVACAGVVMVLWRAPNLDFDTRAAGLIAATLLASPYLWYYEGVLLPAIALFLVRAGVLALRPLPLLVAGLLWLGAGLHSFNFLADWVDYRWIGGYHIPLMLLLCLGLCLRRMRATAAPGTATLQPAPRA